MEESYEILPTNKKAVYSKISTEKEVIAICTGNYHESFNSDDYSVVTIMNNDVNLVSKVRAESGESEIYHKRDETNNLWVEVIYVKPIDKLIDEAYDLHEIAGKKYARTILIKLLKLEESNDITMDEILDIERQMKPVNVELRTGYWVTSQSEMQKILPTDKLDSILEGDSEKLFDVIKNDITTYIEHNY